MSKKMAGVIAASGVVLAALGLIIQQTAPAFAQVVFITGMAGGGLCVLWCRGLAVPIRQCGKAV